MREIRGITRLALLHRILWFALLANATAGFAAPVEFCVRGWSAENGLPAGTITALARTQDGFLWLGTDSGLMRFDGAQFYQLTPAQFPVSPAAKVNCLLVDRTGKLWVGNAAGQILQQESNHQFRLCPMKAAVSNDVINTIFEGPDGLLMAATLHRGILCWRNGQWENWSPFIGIPNRSADKVYWTKDEQLLAIYFNRLFCWDPEQSQFIPMTNTPARPVLYIPRSDGENGWLLTQFSVTRGTRVYEFRAHGSSLEPWDSYPWQQASVRSVANAALYDREGRLWAATVGEGVFYAEPGQPWRLLSSDGPLAHSRVNALLEDDEGAIWFGMEGGQLLQARPRVVSALHPEGANTLSVIYTTCARRDGSIWVGTYGDGVYSLDKEGKWHHYDPDTGLANPYVFAIYEDSNTNLWVGSRRGLFRFDEHKFTLASFMPRLDPFVLAIKEDRKGNLWTSTHRGLVKIKDQTVTEYTKTEGLPAGPDIRAIAEAPDGSIWASILGVGIFRQVGDNFKRFVAPKFPNSADVRAMHFDDNGGLWIATFGTGLFRIRTNDVRQFTTQDGLPSNYLVSLLDDDQGTLWLGTANGIVGLEKTRLESYTRGTNPPLLGTRLSTDEGLASQSCSGWGQPVATRSADGRLWFPNQRSVAFFDPASIRPKRQKSQVIIESLTVDGVTVAAQAGESIRIPSGARRIEFHYTLPDLNTPGQVQFRHQLKGADDTWVDARNARVASYNLLPPAAYEFRVLACGSDGQWQECVAPLKLQIVPRLWERKSVQLGAVVVLVAGISMIVWSVGRARIRGRLLRLEAQHAAERERRRIARDLHDELGSGLTEIMQLGDMGSEESWSPSDLRSNARNIAAKTRQVATALDEIVWTTNPKNDTLVRFSGYLCDYAQEFLGASPIRCRLDVTTPHEDRPLNAVLRHNLFLSCKEALNNVVRHSRATEVWLRINYAEGKLRVVVEDNGRGVAPAELDRFGNGLTNMRERIESSGGMMTLTTTPEKGTSIAFEITLAN